MQTVGAFEAKTHFSALLEEVEREATSITITKHGRAVAKLVPIGHREPLQMQEAIETLKSFHEGRTLGLDWKTLRDAGRR